MASIRWAAGNGPTSVAGITYDPVDLIAVSGVITPDATLGFGPHRYTATGNITLAAPTGGGDGQPIDVQVTASGGARTLSFVGGADPVTIVSGTTWWGRFSYLGPPVDQWLLDDTGGVAGGDAGLLIALTGMTGAAVPGRVLRVGATDYSATIPTGGPDSAFVVADKANDENDASLLLRSGGVQKAEIGLPGDNDLHLKAITGPENSPTYTDALIVKNTTGKVFIPVGLGIGAVPVEKVHVVAAQPTTRLLVKLENTATTGGTARSTGVAMTSGGGGWYLVTDVGLSGGDNLGIMSDTIGYPPVLMMTPNTVGVGTDAPGAKLDVAGAVTIRGDNGLSPMRIRGRKTTTGAPTTGTWAIGDVVMDSAKVWWLCTVAGTPGTWV